MLGPSRSNGNRVRRSTVPAMPPSIISAVWFLYASARLSNSGEISLKFNPRPESAENASRPLNSVRTCVRPRMRMFVGSPEGWVLSSFDCRRLTVMPGRRCSASDAD